jgi:hypothetical protein
MAVRKGVIAINKNSMYILAAVLVIVIVVVAAGAYVFLGMNNGSGTPNVADATSLTYDSDVTYQGATSTYKWTARDMGTSDMALRIEIFGGASGNYTYILNGKDKTAWVGVNDEWSDLSSDFTNQWNNWVGSGKQWTTDVDTLAANWSGTGDYTYTDSATQTTIRIYNIAVNPTIDDSLFQHTT